MPSPPPIEFDALASLLAAVGQGLWQWDCRTDELSISSGWLDSRVPGNDGPGRPGSVRWSQLVHPDDLGRAMDQLAQLTQGSRPLDQTLRLRPGDDDQSHRIRLLGQVVERDEQGRARRCAGLIMDLSEQEQSARELREARDQAREASRAKSEFLSNMSHELRTPLNGVLGYSQLLQRERDLNSTQRDSLRAIESCGQHLLGLINDVLDISKIEAGRMELELQPLRLRGLLEGVRDIISERAHAKGLALGIDIDPAVPEWVRGDPSKLRQILLNLLGNAVKFTERGHVELRVTAAGERMRFEVEDTGIGIPKDKLDVIFDAFKQAETGMAVGGTGLGLAINQRLIRMMEGVPLKVVTELGQGSCFDFHLPLQACEPGDEIPPDSSRHDTADHLPEGHGLAALIVDDRPENRDILCRLLEAEGVTCLQADSGEEAIEVFARTPVQLALVDLRMPGMDGMQTLVKLRELSGGPELKALAVSAAALPDIQRSAESAGFDAYLVKPISVSKLFSEIRRLLSMSEVDRSGRDPGTGDEAWPERQAVACGTALLAALETGNLSLVHEIIGSYTDDPEIPAGELERLQALARRFELDTLAATAAKLQNHAP